MSDERPLITFMSDYGLEDDFVGICHGVIAGICPQARVIDLTHGIPRHDVRAGAMVLAAAMGYLPPGVHLAVVDPDVGASRRAVGLLLADGRRMVGPDNGVLSLAAQRCGGIVEAVDIARSRFRLEPVSATFHGRDIFAPVAAHFAGGVQLAEAGDRVDPEELVQIELPRPHLDGDVLCAHALYIDRFGNVQLDARHEDLAAGPLRLGRPVMITAATGGPRPAQFARTFADVPPGELLIYEDADRQLAVAVSHGDAAALLAVTVDDELRISPR